MDYYKKSRRQFLKQSAITVGGMAGTMAFPSFGQYSNFQKKEIAGNENNIPHPTQAQIAWQNCEVGVIYHFDISVAIGKHTSGNNAYKEVFDPQKYNPKKLDTDQWLKAAKAAGAKYAIFTATHFNGFLQWQSEAYPYGLKQASWKNGKGDIVADFVNSCHKYGIEPGIYLSTHRNAYWELWDYYVDWGKGKGTEQQEKFNRAAEVMVEELCSKYGPLIQIWFDAGTKIPIEGGPDVLPIFNQYQPDSVFYHCIRRSDHRWIGNESGYADYPCWATMPKGKVLSHNSESWKPILGTGDPDGNIWSPGMVDIPLRGTNGIHNWFWAPDQEKGVYPKDQLVKMYDESVGRNANFVIGEVINPDGLVPEYDINILKEFGDEIKNRFSNPIISTEGEGMEFLLELPEEQNINHFIIQEDIQYGERIREYEINGWVNDRWQKLGTGQSVGNKRIQKIENVLCSKIKLIIKKSVLKPKVKHFAAFKIS